MSKGYMVALSYGKYTEFQRNTQMSKENIEAVYADDAAVALSAALAGGKDFDVAEFED